MKKKTNPILIIIAVLVIILGVIIYVYISPSSTSETSTSSDSTKNTTSTTGTVTEVKSSVQTIENTLSSSGQISSALDENLYLHASYYFDSILVDENVYIAEGTNIIKYTNGTYLTAPYDCVITSSNLPSEDAICTSSNYIEVKSIDTLSMSLSVSETEINKVEIGDSVDITITATNEVIEGYITAISEVGTYSSSGSYFNATVTFENNGNLKIGMSATCEIIVESAENVIAVPVEAVQTSDEGSYVIVVNSDGSTKNTSVETGISNDAYTEIKSGISEGTTVQMTEKTSSSTSNMNGGMMNRENFGSGSSGTQIPSGFAPSGGKPSTW